MRSPTDSGALVFSSCALPALHHLALPLLLALFGCNSGGGGGSKKVSVDSEEPQFLENAVVEKGEVEVSPETGAEVTVAGATLSIPKGSVKAPARLGLIAVAADDASLPDADGARLGRRIISPFGFVLTADREVALEKPLVLRLPFDPESVPAGTPRSRVELAARVGGYIVPQGAPDRADLAQGFIEVSIDTPRIEEGTLGQTALSAPRGFGFSLGFLVIAGGLLVGGPLLINPLIVVLDDVNLPRYEVWTTRHFKVLYNDFWIAPGNALDLADDLENAYALFVDDMGFSLPNLINVDSRYTVVIDDLREHSLLPRDGNGEVPEGVTLPGSSLFEGASYLHALQSQEKLRTVAIHEYFHALQYGSLTSPFIVNLGDKTLNSGSGWLFEGSAAALSGRAIYGGGTVPARDVALTNPLRAGASLFDPVQTPAPDVAQDFFFFLERRLGHVDFYRPMFEGLGPSPIDSRERAVRSADETLQNLTDGVFDIQDAWEDFVTDYWIDSRGLYPAANVSDVLNLSNKTKVSAKIELPSLSYWVFQVTVPPLEKAADGSIKPNQRKDLEVDLSIRTVPSTFGYVVVDVVDVLGPAAGLRESLIVSGTASRQRRWKEFRGASRRSLFLIAAFSNPAASSMASLSIEARLLEPEPNESPEFEPGFSYFNFDGSIGTDPAKADIQLSGDLARPVIRWGARGARAVAALDYTDASSETPPKLLYCINASEDESFNEVPFFSPLTFGDYSRPSTEPCSAVTLPAPPLIAGQSYQVVVEPLEGARSASILFKLK